MTLALLFLAAAASSVISALVGMAGGIVLMSLMTFFLPYQLLIPIHGMVQLVSNTSRAFILKKDIYWPIFKWFALGLPVGSLVAIYFIKSISNPQWFLLGVVFLIFYTLFKPKKMPKLQISDRGFCFLGFIVGFMGPLVGATGPLMAPFFLRDTLVKEQIIATKASVQLLGHLIKIPTFLYLGFNYFDHKLLIGVMCLGVIFGTRLGVFLLGKLNEASFRLIFKTALFLSALRILYKLFILG